MKKNEKYPKAFLKPFFLNGKYIWDLWFLKDGDRLFRYFLEAPRSGNPESRHNKSSIGVAVSENGGEWQYGGKILRPSRSGWDNLSIWTGSTFKNNGTYYLFYTSRSRLYPAVQKIGLVTADNPYFHYPEKISEDRPLLTVDAGLFETDSYDGFTHWRDPYVFEENGRYLMLIVARKKSGPLHGRGTIAVAESQDLMNWSITGSLKLPEWFDSCECPYIIKLDGIYHLFFSSFAFADSVSHNLLPGDYHLVSGSLDEFFLPPYTRSSHVCSENDAVNSMLYGGEFQSRAYTTKIIEAEDGIWYAFFWNISKKTHPIFCTHSRGLRTEFHNEKTHIETKRNK